MKIGRIIFSIVVLALGYVASAAFAPQSMLIQGVAAGHQFEPSDIAFVNSFYLFQIVGGVGHAIGILVFITLLAIWWRPLRKAIAALSTMAVVTLFLFPSQPASAFFQQTDKTEAYTVLPNQSAFWIPNAGDNKTNQTQMNSEDYLNANKIAAKLFIIPHVKFTGSGGTSILSGWDYFVPTGRLILVDRTPYSREWVKSASRGTSAHDESFPCQSTEGLNITVGVSIGTSVSETNAAKFLYNFGVKAPAGDPANPDVIFASVYYGRSLAEVMDDVVRKKVQTLVCGEITSRKFDDANKDANLIMTNVAKTTDDFLKGVGITLNFIGWADTFEFDQNVQDAINRRYVAAQDQEIAKALTPYASTIQAIAVASAIRDWGAKADGKFPTTVVGYPADVGGLLTNLLHSIGNVNTTPTAPPK
jgi:SPFH domain / Band 7 family